MVSLSDIQGGSFHLVEATIVPFHTIVSKASLEYPAGNTIRLPAGSSQRNGNASAVHNPTGLPQLSPRYGRNAIRSLIGEGGLKPLSS